MSPYEKYCTDCKRLGFKPTMSEKQVNEAWGINKPDEPIFVSRNSTSEKQMKPTITNHEKKTYAPKISRKGWTKEQIAARRAENTSRYREKKKSNEVIL